MSTFLTQGNAGSQNRPESQQMNSQLLYAPFVQPTDKVKRDVDDLSFADFQPKRFALNYEPPIISNYLLNSAVLEYLVPSTGKLYHHKMKLRQLKADSDTNEMIEYLKKRHPLYFTTNKLNTKQISDLINRLKYKMKQKGGSSLNQSSTTQNSKVDSEKTGSKISSMGQKENAPTTQFKSGSQLPSISDNTKPLTSGFPPVPGQANRFAFDQNEYDDDFEDDGKDEGYGDEEEEEDGDFDANELLNLTDYQNKRKGVVQPQANAKSVPKKQEEEEEYEDDWGDDWGAPQPDKFNDLQNFDYENQDLNKLSDYQLARHKQKMEIDFQKNNLKPGDPGFQYDKRVDFSKQEKVDDGWDEEDDEFFDDDFV